MSEISDAVHYHLDSIFIRFGSNLLKQAVGIPIGTRVKSGIFGQTAKVGQRHSLFHSRHIRIIKRLTKQ